jgi:hypothetical protein
MAFRKKSEEEKRLIALAKEKALAPKEKPEEVKQEFDFAVDKFYGRRVVEVSKPKTFEVKKGKKEALEAFLEERKPANIEVLVKKAESTVLENFNIALYNKLKGEEIAIYGIKKAPVKENKQYKNLLGLFTRKKEQNVSQ